MGAMGAEDLVNLQGIMDGGTEKILVLVRLRPLSEKENARNEVTDWECINSTTILYRNSLQERSGLPTAYSFDRVFRGDCKTREVYDDGIKDIALSVVGGINSTVFAYGMTSSGKTYTMNGITEYTVADIYDYMQKHEERAFVLKFSAIEIYNEVVRDLLGTDSTPLRLLDDPERGTIIEKLTEETLRDWNHLKKLLSICEDQRQIAETSLNNASSRSHQILRLTIESSAREFIGKSNSTTLAASVNFVDLAGSERASQALSVGKRLKEGCHINRSLLTLSTVIRKLSRGRQGHVNYRDSKLTRILQPALGGNARTAIICTLSPARSHVEQSRNTLIFASCAKEVSTNAKVNVLMSDKTLVKHLQKEVARLESELKTPGSICDHGPLLRKKDIQIEKLEKEIRELKKQRDLADSRIDDLLGAIESDRYSQNLSETHSLNRECRYNRKSDSLSENDTYSSEAISDPIQEKEQPIGEDSVEDRTEARYMQTGESDHNIAYESLHVLTSERENNMPILSDSPDGQIRVNVNNYPYSVLKQNVRGVQKTIDSLFGPHRDEVSPGASSSTSMTFSGSSMSRSRSCRAGSITVSSNFEMNENNKSTPPTVLDEDFTGSSGGLSQTKQWKIHPMMHGANNAKLLSSNESQLSDYSGFVDDLKNQSSGNGDADIPTLGSFVAGLKEMAKLQYENHDLQQVQQIELEKDTGDVTSGPTNNWLLKFEKLQKLIIGLWQDCNVSLVHRTYFFLLIKDVSTDYIYMEVEYRRLSFLKETFFRGSSSVQDGRTLTLASSKKSLRPERETLGRLIYKRYTADERNTIYNEWGIRLNSKRRKLQLVNLLWSKTENMDHVRKSAAIVAKLIGFSEHGQELKEMLGFSFTAPRMIRRSFGWKNSMPTLL